MQENEVNLVGRAYDIPIFLFLIRIANREALLRSQKPKSKAKFIYPALGFTVAGSGRAANFF